MHFEILPLLKWTNPRRECNIVTIPLFWKKQVWKHLYKDKWLIAFQWCSISALIFLICTIPASFWVNHCKCPLIVWVPLVKSVRHTKGSERFPQKMAENASCQLKRPIKEVQAGETHFPNWMCNLQSALTLLTPHTLMFASSHGPSLRMFYHSYCRAIYLIERS